jgi:hypothetical protein
MAAVKRICLAAATLAAGSVVAGCDINPPPPPPASVAGIVQVVSYGHQFGTGNVWTAELTPDSGSYDGYPNVNLSNDGDDGCIFAAYVHSGDHLTVVAAFSGSFNELAPSDVTDNTTGMNLGRYSVSDSC